MGFLRKLLDSEYKELQRFEKIALKIEALDEEYSKLSDDELRHKTDDATVNACFDADRLDLGRVGITPNPDKMATVQGRILAEKIMEVNPKEDWLLNGG